MTTTNTSIWTRSFWKGAAERAIKTFAQSVLGSFGVLEAASLLTGADAEAALSVQVWQAALLIGLVNAVLSVFTSIANPPFVAGSNDVVTQYVPLTAPAPEAVAAAESNGRHVAEPETSEAAPVATVIHEA